MTNVCNAAGGSEVLLLIVMVKTFRTSPFFFFTDEALWRMSVCVSRQNRRTQKSINPHSLKYNPARSEGWCVALSVVQSGLNDIHLILNISIAQLSERAWTVPGHFEQVVVLRVRALAHRLCVYGSVARCVWRKINFEGYLAIKVSWSLTSLLLFVGSIKRQTYKQNPYTLQELKDVITSVIQNITQLALWCTSCTKYDAWAACLEALRDSLQHLGSTVKRTQ
jgi:hypothetical protein